MIQKRGRLVSLRINHVEHGDNRHHRVRDTIVSELVPAGSVGGAQTVLWSLQPVVDLGKID